uniref:Metallo-beta-lactamase domain-containing protein n=1 Tax=Oryza punctata TaxID=4537 RepID=A0A0E0K797_ORYPU
MALSLRFAAAPPRRPRAIASFRACSASSPALNSGRRPQNVPGDFFVDHRCIDCQTCRWMAPGSVCLFYKPVKALFTGDHVAKSEESDDYLFLMYNRQPVSLQLDSLRKLLKLDFEWFLPGHGYRIHYKDVRAKDSAIESEILVYGNRNLTKRTRTLTLLFRTMALMSLRFAPAAAPPSASVAAPPRRRARPVASSSSASSPALESRRRPQNVPGDFFVDHRCIDCQTCRWMAPEVFKRVDGKAAVAAQPISDDHRTKALQALLSCPTASIHTDKPAKDILQVQNMFPLPIDTHLLPVLSLALLIQDFTQFIFIKLILSCYICHPCCTAQNFQGVYLCGYHSQDSYGATSYLITHPHGNILVDSPRYTTKLADNIEKLGGARYMFLTHRDDVADHRKWAERLKCERIIHSGDVEDVTADVEWKLTGNGPWDIGADFELIHTPGHTEGSVCLFYKPIKALFTGDHVAKSEESDDLDLFLIGLATGQHEKIVEVRLRVDMAIESIIKTYMLRIQQSKTFVAIEH